MRRTLALILLAMIMVGCGYHQTNEYEKGPAVGQGPINQIYSVAVPTFANESGVAGVEGPVTQAVRDAISSQTTAKLMDQKKADSSIEGKILEVKLRKPATRPSSPSDIDSIRIEYTWRNLWLDTTILDVQVRNVSSYTEAGQAVTAYMRGTADTGAAATDAYPWHSLYREDVRTVAVPIFTNRSYVRGVEMQLTKAIGNYMESSTLYKIVPREKADTILEGEIASVTGVPISYNRVTNLPQEEMVTVTVNFVWKDQRNGKILAQRKGFEQTTVYYPTLGEAMYIGTQTNVEKLAVAIVQALQAEW